MGSRNRVDVAAYSADVRCMELGGLEPPTSWVRSRRQGVGARSFGDYGGWRPRRGRVPEGFFDEKRATVRTAELVAEHDAGEREIECERRELAATVRELATEWLDYLGREKGAKPATIQDYGYLLTEPGTPHRRGSGRSPGRIMHALGDRRIAKVATADVARFLRGLEREGMSARSVNKHRVAGRRRQGSPMGRPSGGRGRIARTQTSTASPRTRACDSASCSRCAGRTSISSAAK